MAYLDNHILADIGLPMKPRMYQMGVTTRSMSTTWGAVYHRMSLGVRLANWVTGAEPPGPNMDVTFVSFI